MDKKTERNTGKMLLISKYRGLFRIPENLNHYSPDDYAHAERKFIKMLIETGGSPVKRN